MYMFQNWVIYAYFKSDFIKTPELEMKMKG